MLQCKCENIIPQGRVNLGFKVCVDCSTTEAYGCAPLINHKTGNSIQIMSSSDAARISKLTQRRGYGTMLGVFTALIMLTSSCAQTNSDELYAQEYQASCENCDEFD